MKLAVQRPVPAPRALDPRRTDLNRSCGSIDPTRTLDRWSSAWSGAGFVRSGRLGGGWRGLLRPWLRRLTQLWSSRGGGYQFRVVCPQA
jgi:hypothetical protein